jgi:hypothetical protein
LAIPPRFLLIEFADSAGGSPGRASTLLKFESLIKLVLKITTGILHERKFGLIKGIIFSFSLKYMIVHRCSKFKKINQLNC